MKIKEGFIKSKVMGQAVVVSTREDATDFNMIKLNETASDIWDGIEAGKTEQVIAEELAAKYEIDLETASKGVTKQVSEMKKIGVVEE